ncbi:hypothetical protein LTR50_007360 [Elasticomyces elasticus]|nr:hypothetical protein LTR50_007360 [Elasticomyces elasticus]
MPQSYREFWQTHILKGRVTAGRRYRLQLRDLDLHVKWWTYGAKNDLPDPLPPSKTTKLVAARHTQKEFLVVESLPRPPPVSISFSLSPRVVHRSGNPSTILRLEITNRGSRPITVKSSGDQPYMSSMVPYAPPTNHTHITSTTKPITIENFSIFKASATHPGDDLMHSSSHCTMPVGPDSGWSRRGFTVLEPGVPLMHEEPFLPDAVAIKNKMVEAGGGEFRPRLRSLGVWWCYGTIDELFMGGQTLKRWPGQPTPPLMLESDDEVILSFEE